MDLKNIDGTLILLQGWQRFKLYNDPSTINPHSRVNCEIRDLWDLESHFQLLGLWAIRFVNLMFTTIY